MSGGNMGGYIPTQRITFDCETGSIASIVSSIELAILAGLKNNDILGVVLENKTLILINGNGERLGSIIHSNTKEIIDCINSGNEYTARITSIQAAQCRVLIKRKK